MSLATPNQPSIHPNQSEPFPKAVADGIEPLLVLASEHAVPLIWNRAIKNREPLHTEDFEQAMHNLELACRGTGVVAPELWDCREENGVLYVSIAHVEGIGLEYAVAEQFGIEKHNELHSRVMKLIANIYDYTPKGEYQFHDLYYSKQHVFDPFTDLLHVVDIGEIRNTGSPTYQSVLKRAS